MSTLKQSIAPRSQERVITRVPVESIAVRSEVPRRTFSEKSIAELAESIQQYGLLTPLLVRRIDAERYELIAGERRLRALIQLGKNSAEVIVLSAYDGDCALLSMTENLQRETLHYLDEAEAYRRILDARGMTQAGLARMLACSPSMVANRLRLLKLSPAVRSLLREMGLSERHARAILRLDDEKRQLTLLREAGRQRWSIRQLEARVERALCAAGALPSQRISRVVRDNRIVINAVMNTVKELKHIGVRASGRVEEHGNSVDVIVTIQDIGPMKQCEIVSQPSEGEDKDSIGSNLPAPTL